MYSDLINDETVQGHFLVVLKPRRKVTGFTVFSGSVYEIPFDYTNFVSSVTQDGVALTQAFSTSLSAGQYYYNDSLKKLYVRMTDSSNPSTKFVVATFEIYLGTYDAHWYRVPDDDSTQVVYFEPLIVNAPTIKDDISDTLFGIMPTQSSTLVLSNAEHTIEKWIYDSSLNQSDCDVYHVLGSIERIDLDNVKLILKAIGSNIQYTQKNVSISLLNRTDELKPEWRNVGKSFYALSDYPLLNPSFTNKPVRYVYGRVEGFVPVNVSFVSNQPTTSQNRDWAVIGEQTGLAEITRTVSASPASTTTRTYLGSTQGLAVGDTVKITGSITAYVLITNVVRTGSQYIEHAALGVAAVSGDVVHRGFVSSIVITQRGVRYQAMYLRDYTINLSMTGGISGFSFSTSLESNLSMPATLQGYDTVFCTVYGRVNDLTLGGPSFGANDAETGNLAHPVLVLYDMMKSKLGLGESRLNLTSFSSAYTSTEAVSFAIPETAQGGFQQFKNLILPLLQTFLGRLQIDSDLKWKLTEISPISGAPDNTVEPEEILQGAFDYRFQTKDICSEIQVTYAKNEFDKSEKTENSTSDTASFLHLVKTSKAFRSLHIREADAQVLADRIRFYLGERIGELSLTLKSRFFATELSDVIRVQRVKLPGFLFDADLVRERDFKVVQVEKGLKTVKLSLDDQKGIEDNEGSW